ncbi:MAG TPA: PilZ domain-containing protein [Tepidisphaeraceae bacterium]|jgi:hypothetical protein
MTQTESDTMQAELTAAAERRRSPRQRRETTAWLSAASGQRNGNGIHVRVRDLSLHGVGYVADIEPKKNATHWMVIAEQSLRLSTRLRVVAARQREDGKWDVGGEFF